VAGSRRDQADNLVRSSRHLLHYPKRGETDGTARLELRRSFFARKHIT